MRTSLALAVLITAPTLLVACSQAPAKPIRGTVVEMEYEPARACPVTKVKSKKSAKPCTPRQECYELDILLDYSGNVDETCDKAAYMVLDVGDRYSSDVDYNREEH